VLRVTDVVRTYDIVFAATGGGPGDSTNLLMLFAVKQGLQFFDIGYGSAISILMTLCIGVIATVLTIVLGGLNRRFNGP
jgi:multiple sugar transport system permease protein